jgi:hypothetical protein
MRIQLNFIGEREYHIGHLKTLHLLTQEKQKKNLASLRIRSYTFPSITNWF